MSRLPWLPSAGPAILEGLLEHRGLTTSQLHQLYLPDSSKRHIRQCLQDLGRHKTIDWVYAHHTRRERFWFLTTDGVRAATASVAPAQHRSRALTRAQASGVLQL